MVRTVVRDQMQQEGLITGQERVVDRLTVRAVLWPGGPVRIRDAIEAIGE